MPDDALSQFTQSNEEMPYFAALGKFIVIYAMAEGSIHELTRYLIGINEAKSRILLSGSRIGDVETRLRGLLQLSRLGRTKRQIIDHCLRQFDILGKQRDKLVHRFVAYRYGRFAITNVLTAKSIASLEQEILTKKDLENMECDCGTIFLCFAHISGHLDPKQLNEPLRTALHSSWLYKLPQLQNKRKASRQRIAQALARPPQS